MKISIVTPNYNYSRFLPQLFNSIIAQDYEDWEHIIVDDGSTDNSADIIREYASRDKRIKFLFQENKGQTPAINRALKEVGGNIICWINSDDWFAEGAFRKAADIFERNPGLDILYGDGIYFKVAENKFKLRKQLPFDFELFAFTGFGNSVMSNTIFWRRKILDENFFFNEDLVYNMDGEFFARIFRGRKIKYAGFPVAFFRWHDEAKTIKNRGSERTLKYNEELRNEIQSSLSYLGKNDLLNKKSLKIHLSYYKFKRIILRFINGHYFLKWNYNNTFSR